MFGLLINTNLCITHVHIEHFFNKIVEYRNGIKNWHNYVMHPLGKSQQTTRTQVLIY